MLFKEQVVQGSIRKFQYKSSVFRSAAQGAVMFKSICRESLFPLVVMMILCLPSSSHSNPCIGFGVPENYAMPAEGCDSVASGECQYTPPFVCTDANPSYTWEIIRPADPSLGKGGSIDQTGKLAVDGASCGTITVKVTGSCGLTAEKEVRLGAAGTASKVTEEVLGCSEEQCGHLDRYQCEVGATSYGFRWNFSQNPNNPEEAVCPNCPHLGWPPCPDFHLLRTNRKVVNVIIGRWVCKE
ncbi:MAG TPA: hypothetical protein PK250_14435 [Syntrophobacter fumaroxidans]|nr:hypothetical protein [Syntrophobacter fumaroxidans]